MKKDFSLTQFLLRNSGFGKCLISRSVTSDLLQAPWTMVLQTSLSMGFFRQECWSRLPFPPPADLPDPGIESTSPVSPVLQVDSLPAETSGKPDCQELFNE